MATGLFAKGRQKFLIKLIDWDTDDIRMVFVDTVTDLPVLATDEWLSDIGAGARVATSGTLTTNVSAGTGVADATDETVASVTGAVFQAIVFYLHTGVAGTSALIAMVDNYTGLPCTPNGSNITVAFPSDSNKIFML